MAGAANNQKKYRINWVTGGFMLALAAIFDLLQVFLTLTVLLAIGSYMIDFFYLAIFPLWFYICGVTPIGGKKSGLKMVSMFGGVVIETIPLFNALPAITISVLGLIIASRMEDRSLRKGDTVKAETSVRFPRTTKVQQPANRNYPKAANDDEEEYAQAA